MSYQTWRRRPLLFLVTALVLSTAACDRPADRTTGPPPRVYSIAVVGPTATHPQWPAISRGALKAAERYGNARVLTSAPLTASAEALDVAVREALAAKPDAVCLYVLNPEAVEAAIPLLVESGALVVTMGAGIANSSFFGHVDSNIPGGAELLGERLDVIADGGRSYVLVHESGANTLATQCADRFNLGIREHYGLQRLDERNASQSTRAAHELIREMLDQFPNVAMVVTFNADAWLAVQPDVLLGPRTRFATMPATPELWPWVRSGRAAALVGPVDGEIGDLAVELAMNGLTSERGGGGVRVVRSELVNARNLDDFARRYAEAAGTTVAELLRAAAKPESGGPP
ncbi:MAG: sugar ABC transporter substrate-binding protein [Phycisphaerae bacterium]|nr:sugar ABC transporter substrate-binding protein [Phycisphaerae bacterium]MCZ2398246.1 sugar ABC transporter substrate-binding protein [Phycisphaerae bacterium]NUQ49361.1 sugar ABC transporter substrate-binding protein [Phycisphaerae bacterium]